MAYAFDASGLTYLPEAVAVPANAAEVAAILKLANEENFPVIPRGAGTATTGAPLAVAGGLVLSLLGLNRILEINPDDLVAVVEPGVFNGTFKRELAERGLFYPPDPASYEFSTLGGNVATCAGGPKGLKYGVTKDYVLGLEVVLPTGEIVFCGRRTMKGVVGYDLVSLIVGSEGTLGVITKMVLKLLPKPPATASLAVYFERITQAAEGFLALVKGGLLPAAAELLDAVTLQAVARFFPKDWPEKTRALLLLQFDGARSQVKEDLKRASEILEPYALRLTSATSPPDEERLWQARRNISPALKKIAPGKIADDVVLARSKVPHFLEEVKRLGDAAGLYVACFGHLGDGNIHVNILFEPAQREKAERLREEILSLVLRLAGTVSGEHGIGLTKKGYLPKELPPRVVSLMKDLKRVFDPKNILNPGKIF